MTLAVLGLAGCAGDGPSPLAPVSVPSEAPRASARHRADADHAKLVAAFGGEARAPRAAGLITEITDRLVKATDRPEEAYAVTILDAPAVNAFALPSGRLYVTRGLLALANDSSEVAAVLAHEIAHVTLRHASARSELALRSALVSRVVTDVLSDPTTGAQIEDQSRFAMAKFSRAQEFEADTIGVRTLSRAGYDPFGAARFLTALARTTELRAAGGGAPDLLSSHPSTPERVQLATQAARRIGAPGLGAEDRARYLAAIDGLAYGDNPGDGLVRGRRFVHPRLNVAFATPDGFTLENTARAVLGATADGSRRLLFDSVESSLGQSLEDVLRTTWTDPLDGTVENRIVNGNAAVLGTSKGKEWTFRLAAMRVGSNTFRLVMATRGAVDVEPLFARWLESVGPVPEEEAAALRTQRLQVATAAAGDTAEAFAARMAVPDRALDRFLVLNGLARGGALQAGQGYKLVVE